MKLSQLSSASTTTLELLHPVEGTPLGVYITGYTPDSVRWKQLDHELTKGGKETSFIATKEGPKTSVNTREQIEKRRKQLIGVITDITGIDGWEFSQDAATKLFDDPEYQWMLEQWGEHLDDRSNFFGKSATAPAPSSK